MYPVSHSNVSLPPRLDDTRVILVGGEQNIINPRTNDDNNMTSRSLLSPCIEVTGYDMPASIIVPMVNREEEMQQVVQFNTHYFVQVQQQVDEHTFKKFQSTLYASRTKLNDHDWLDRIEHFLMKLSPSLWETFQALVGHTSTSTITKMATVSRTSPPDSPTVSTPSFLSARPPLLSQLHGIHGSSSRSSSKSSSSSFRYLYEEHGYFFDPQIRQKKSFKVDVTPFLQECKMAMDDSEYRLFVHWLFAPCSKISNEYWESALYECLNHHPILFLKLKEWIDHELY